MPAPKVLIYGKTEDDAYAPIRIDADGVLQTNVSISGGGDASAANQTTEIASLNSIDGHVDGLEAAVASTNTKLDTVHTDLGTINGHVDGLEASATSIDGKLTDVATQTTLALIKAKTDNLDTALSGIKTGTDKIISAPATSAKQDTGNTSLSSIDGKIPALGQAVAGGSVPVVLTAAQITTLTPTAAITGFSTSAKQDTGNTSVGNIDTNLGAAADTAANADTGTFSLIAITKRIVAKLTSILAGIPLLAGEAHIGEVGPNLTLTSFTLVLDTSQYASGDVLSDTAAIASVFRVATGKGIITSLVLNDEDDQGVALDVVFLDANVSLGTFNVAPTISDANARNILGIASVYASDWIDLGGVRVATIPANRLGILLKASTGTTSLFMATITRGGTPTYTVSGITGRIGVECS